MKISLEGNLVLKSANQIAKICRPLEEYFGIKMFRYLKIYKDGSVSLLSNHPELMKFIYEEGYYSLTWHDSGKPSSELQSACLYFATHKENTKQHKHFLDEMKKQLHLSEGIAFREKHKNFIEIFEYANNDNNIYRMNSNILKRFNYYFKDQARKLILASNHEKIKVPYENASNEIIQPTHQELEFLNTIPVKRYYFNDFYLTDREVECLKNLKGHTAKELGLLLHVSKRTIEMHLENIKRKLNCTKQSELLEIAEKLL